MVKKITRLGDIPNQRHTAILFFGNSYQEGMPYIDHWIVNSTYDAIQWLEEKAERSNIYIERVVLLDIESAQQPQKVTRFRLAEEIDNENSGWVRKIEAADDVPTQDHFAILHFTEYGRNLPYTEYFACENYHAVREQLLRMDVIPGLNNVVVLKVDEVHRPKASIEFRIR